MIFLLQKLFQDVLGWHFPAVFLYTSTRAIVAAITSLCFCLSFGPYFIRKLYEFKIGQPIREKQGVLLDELHKNKKNTPTMGGILLVVSLLVSLLLWMDLSNPFTWVLFFTTTVLALLGGYDDYLKLRYKNSKGLSAKKKLLVQFLVACGVIVSQQWYLSSDFVNALYCPFFKEPILLFSGISCVILWAFSAFVIVGSSNAVNLADGLDGLATGLCIFVLAAIGVFAFLSNYAEMANYLNLVYIEGAGEIAVFLSGACGACLGFLWFNCHPAQLFMGDIGSLTLGGIIGTATVLLKRELLLGVIGGVFVVEALSVIIQVGSYKWRNKKRVFLCAPLHHHFEYKGWPETKVVMRFWIIGLLLSLIGLISIKFQ